MGIKFACTACGHVLHVKEYLAGKRGICPKCQAKLEIPAESSIATSSKTPPSGIDPGLFTDSIDTAPAETQRAIPAGPVYPVVGAPTGPVTLKAIPLAGEKPADPITEAPQMLWYVLPPGAATPYGPAQGEIFRSWITEGRVSPDSMVWRQDWADWQKAGEALPQLAVPVISAPPPPPGVVRPAVPLIIDPEPASPAVVLTSQPLPKHSRAAAQKDYQRTMNLVITLLVILILALIYPVWRVISNS